MKPAPRWAAAAAWLAVIAAAPTVIWRMLVGLGLDLGTPAAWRAAEQIPGSGTLYVLGLSVVELCAACLTLLLVRPGGDVVPRWSPIAAGRRLPMGVVAAIALAGAVVVTVLCVLSIRSWPAVDPFAGMASSAWSTLCGACYLAALVWPPALVVAVIGYVGTRRRRGRLPSA